MKPQLIIVGAGMSGLLLAYLLRAHYQITLLEARPRIGGRILTVEEGGEHFDLGPTWVWPHHYHIRHLIDTLGLTLFRQYDSGAFAYDAPEGVHYFRDAQNAPSYRLKNGASALTDSLWKHLENVELRLETPIVKIVSDDDGVTLFSDRERFHAAQCIVTLPPRLCAQTIVFEPPLPDDAAARMRATPTWMAFSSKCILTYAEPFWRRRGLSGFASSHLGPLGEIHDASTETKGALFGFYHSDAADDAQPDKVVEQLARLFGPEAYGYELFRYHNWRIDPFTSVNADSEPLSGHPHYGMEIVHTPRVRFCGTETSEIEGGYLEGAVIAAMRLAKSLSKPA